MKTILCFGDSNTFGFDPQAYGLPQCRFDPDVRWTGVLQQALGGGYRVVEEGLGGRTTCFDDPTSPGRSGLTWLLPCMQSHQPLDLVVIMLGTNDVKVQFSAAPMDIAAGMERLVQIARNPFYMDSRQAPEVLVVSPIHVGDDVAQSWLWGMFDQSSVEKSRNLAPLYLAIAERYGCHYLDAAKVAKPMASEGVHLTAAGHGALGTAIADNVRRIL